METTLKKPSKIYISDKAKNVIIDVISYVFIALFVYTATDKLNDLTTFTKFMTKLDVIGSFGTYTALAIPITELLITILLIAPSTREKGLIGSVILMSIFTIYLIFMKMTAEHLPCHCGGVISLLSWTHHIYLNFIFITIAGIGIYLTSRKNIKK